MKNALYFTKKRFLHSQDIHFFYFPLPLFSPIQLFLNLQEKPSENKF